MSFPTEPDGTARVTPSRRHVFQTQRDPTRIQQVAAPTQRNAEADANPASGEWIATPTLREGTGYAPAQPEPPQALLHRYAMVAYLVRGAEADVWQVRRREDARDCLLKVYFPGIRPEPRVMDALSALPRAHVPALYEFGKADGCDFEVQEFLTGGNLREQIRFAPLDSLSALPLLQELTEALVVLHAGNPSGATILHGDIKPENILLRGFEPQDYVLADFGVATIIEEGGSTPRRRGHTPHYSAPECLAGAPGVKSDYWSLGMTLLEALTGNHPFARIASDEIARNITAWQPDFPDEITPRWRELIGGLLQTDARQRWSGTQVQHWLQQESEGHPAEPVPPVLASPRELATYLAQNWNWIAPLLQASTIPGWLRAQVEVHTPEIVLDEILAEPGSNDLHLLRLIYRLAPELPALWKEWMVEPDDVAAICAGAASGDLRLQAVTRALYEQDVLGEIGRQCTRTELGRLAKRWREGWQRFVALKTFLMRMGAPVDRLRSDAVMQALLYLALLRGVPNPYQETRLSLRLCCPWAAYLLTHRKQDVAVELMTAWLLPTCEHAHEEHTSEQYDFDHGRREVAEPFFQIGKNRPVVALSAYYAPIYYRFCDQAFQIGTQIRLSWNVSGAFSVYLTGVGKVPPVGSCMQVVGSSMQHSLLAIGFNGIQQVDLPQIETPQLCLSPQVDLCGEATPGNTLGASDLNPIRDIKRDLVAWAKLGKMLGRQNLPAERDFDCTDLGQDDLPGQVEWHAH